MHQYGHLFAAAHFQQHMDIAKEMKTPSEFDLFNAYRMQQEHLLHQAPQVLDLSRRSDPVDTRKTPSPSGSSANNSLSGSPSTNCSSPILYPNTMIANPLAMYPAMFAPVIKQETLSPPLSQGSPQPFMASYPPNPLLHSLSMMPNLQIPKPQEDDRMSAGPESPASLPDSLSSSVCSNEGKSQRPFKEYHRDPVLLAAKFEAADFLLKDSKIERYSSFRKRMLGQLERNNGGQRTVTNPKMRRTSGNNNNNSIENEAPENPTGSEDSTTSNGIVKDSSYFERRRKNNAAAKKSRDRRRIKEDEIAIRATYLERQNIELMCQIESLKAQLAAKN